MKNLKKIVSILIAVALLSSITGCGSSAAKKSSSDIKAQTVVVGTEGAYPPYNYVDSSGKADGYDMAVMRALDDLIPEVNFKFQPTSWDSIFVALESGKFDIIASQIAKNPAREQKYQFSELPYGYSGSSIIYKGGRKDIKSLKDLYGKTVAAGVGSNNTTWLENYNKQHNNPIKLKYYDGDVSVMLQDIAAGRVDATINNEVTTKLIAKKQSLNLGYSLAPELGIQPVYLLFSKNTNGTKYKKLIDKALKTLSKNGTLSKLSKKYLGADYSTEKAVESQK